jgi:primosomal protein N' (replication factor Y)
MNAKTGARKGERVPAATLPVGRIVVDVPLAHLDRPFDYLIPSELDATAVEGCRVRVRFAGQLVDGYLLERVATSEYGKKLSFIEKVVSPEPVLAPEIATLARAIADRYAGGMIDVLRLAIPPRHARAEAAASGEPSPLPQVPAWVEERPAAQVELPEPAEGTPSGPQESAGEPPAAGESSADATTATLPASSDSPADLSAGSSSVAQAASPAAGAALSAESIPTALLASHSASRGALGQPTPADPAAASPAAQPATSPVSPPASGVSPVDPSAVPPAAPPVSPGVPSASSTDPSASPSAAPPVRSQLPPVPSDAWSRYPRGPKYLEALREGRPAHAVWQALPSEDWPARLAEAAAAVASSGRGVVIVVPDHRDLARVAEACGRLIEGVVTMSADLGP